MQYFSNSEQTASRQLIRLLSFSWLSGLVAVIGTLLVVVGGIMATKLNGSTLQQAVFTAQNSSATSYQQLTSKFSDNSLISNLPLLLFWLFVGFIVYYFANAIYNSVHEAVELEHEMSYVNASRSKLLHQALLHLAVRAVTLAAWFIYIRAFLQQLLPYVLASIHKLALAPGQSHNVVVGLLATLGLFIGWQIHAVFLRLALLRTRTFS